MVHGVCLIPISSSFPPFLPLYSAYFMALWQLQRTILRYHNETAPSFSNLILSHRSSVKYASNPTIKCVCSQHGHAIGRAIMETEIYGRDQVSVWGIVPYIIVFLLRQRQRSSEGERCNGIDLLRRHSFSTLSGIINVIVIFDKNKNKRALVSANATKELVDISFYCLSLALTEVGVPRLSLFNLPVGNLTFTLLYTHHWEGPVARPLVTECVEQTMSINDWLYSHRQFWLYLQVRFKVLLKIDINHDLKTLQINLYLKIVKLFFSEMIMWCLTFWCPFELDKCCQYYNMCTD